MAENHTPVLIVGGGIVGLSASLFLSSHNVSHILVERHSGSSIYPRARGFNTRAMEIYRSIQVDDAVREAGANLAPSVGMYRGSTFFEVINPRPRKDDANRGTSPFSAYFDSVGPIQGARCTQDKFEPLIAKIARERGGILKFNTECTEIEQDETGINVTLRDRETDTISQLRAEYLIAADGAGSPIRKKLGITTTGKGPLGNLINILFKADLTDFVKGREISICRVERPEVRGILTAIDNRDCWVFHLSYEPEKGERAIDYTLERCQDLLRLAIGIPDLKIEIKGMNPWQPSDVAASKMQQGRIFLAGDAAHQTTPYAGQGATTGVADVYDLSWKLAMVLNKQAPPRLLSTFETERLPVARFVARESGELSDKHGLPIATNGKLSLIRTMLIRAPMIAGFGYHYTVGAIIPEPESSNCNPSCWWNIPWSIPSLTLGINGKPGTRAPHIWVHLKGKRVSTLDLFGKEFVLIAGSKGQGWCEAATKVWKRMGIDAMAYRAGPTGEVSDPGCQWEYAANIPPQGAVLIRPDGFVAWRVREQDGNLVERVKGVMNKILCD